jgi:hypothetical protein
MNDQLTRGIGTIKRMAAAHVSFNFCTFFNKDRLDKSDGSDLLDNIERLDRLDDASSLDRADELDTLD